jgi:hypothetical protein
MRWDNQRVRFELMRPKVSRMETSANGFFPGIRVGKDGEVTVGSMVGVADGKLGVSVGLCVATGVVVFVETISTRSVSVGWDEIFRHPDSRLAQASRVKIFLKCFIDTSL